MRSHAPLAALLAVALAGPASFARDTSKKSTTKAPAAGSKKPAPAAADHDFGCTLAAADLKPWTAQGIRVPAAAKAKFKLWKSVSSAAGLSASAKSKCTKLPPQGAFVKGPGAGATTKADLVVAQQDVTVYRAYSKDSFSCAWEPVASEFGGWWALTPPSADKEKYREGDGGLPLVERLQHEGAVHAEEGHRGRDWDDSIGELLVGAARVRRAARHVDQEVRVQPGAPGVHQHVQADAGRSGDLPGQLPHVDVLRSAR